jgi:hypothetical protein
MKFCISKITNWSDIGFDTTNWRKSQDGLYAIVHYEYAKLLKPDIDTDMNIQIKEYQSADLENALVQGWGNEPSNIDQLRLQMIEKMRQTCEFKIINEFYSDCMGELKRFDCELTDQSNIAGLVSVAMLLLNGTPIEESLRWKSSDMPICINFLPQQIMKLGLDLHKHKTECILQFEKLRMYINDISRIYEEIKNITWDLVL